MPTPGGDLDAVTRNGRIVAVGGVANGNTGAVEEFDPATKTWRALAPMPTPRDHLAADVLNGKFYVAGGQREGRGNLNTLEEYDPAANGWAARKPMPTARSGIAAGELAGRLFGFGGEDDKKTYNETEGYDPATDAWMAAPRMPTSRHRVGAATLAGAIHVLTGGKTPGLSGALG